VAIERGEVLSQISEVEKSIDRAEKMVYGDMLIEVEGVKQPLLIAAVLSHHAGALPPAGLRNLRP
jgi:hypothetical protein